jgi:hypothetical protein
MLHRAYQLQIPSKAALVEAPSLRSLFCLGSKDADVAFRCPCLTLETMDSVQLVSASWYANFLIAY